MNCPYCYMTFDGVHSRYAHITAFHAHEEKERMDDITRRREAARGEAEKKDQEGLAWKSDVEFPIDRLLLLSVVRHEKANREATHKSLAKHTGVPERSVNNIMARLRKRNLVFATKAYPMKAPGQRSGGMYYVFHFSGVAKSGE